MSKRAIRSRRDLPTTAKRWLPPATFKELCAEGRARKAAQQAKEAGKAA